MGNLLAVTIRANRVVRSPPTSRVASKERSRHECPDIDAGHDWCGVQPVGLGIIRRWRRQDDPRDHDRPTRAGSLATVLPAIQDDDRRIPGPHPDEQIPHGGLGALAGDDRLPRWHDPVLRGVRADLRSRIPLADHRQLGHLSPLGRTARHRHRDRHPRADRHSPAQPPAGAGAAVAIQRFPIRSCLCHRGDRLPRGHRHGHGEGGQDRHLRPLRGVDRLLHHAGGQAAAVQRGDGRGLRVHQDGFG